MSWTDKRVEDLKRLWLEGLSANQIAAELGDVTRNAVIGKVNRLGLSGRVNSCKPRSPGLVRRARPKGFTRPRRTSNLSRVIPEESVKPKAIISEPAMLCIGYFERKDGMCSFALDSAGIQEKLCGCACSPRKPFCDYHEQITHSGVPKPRGRYANRPKEIITF